MKKFTILEIIEELYKDKNLMAFKDIHQGRCYIKWIDRRRGSDEYKQLAYINVTGSVNYNILTDDMLDINKDPVWSIDSIKSDSLIARKEYEAVKNIGYADSEFIPYQGLQKIDRILKKKNILL